MVGAAKKEEVALKDLEAFCRKLTSKFGPRQLILLDGPLGAGKTQFVKTCVKILGGDVPDSPTFAIINEYAGPQPIFHVDLYRLTTEAEIESTGFWDLFTSAEGLIFVEWAEHVPSTSWPMSWPRINVQIDFGTSSDTRTMKLW